MEMLRHIASLHAHPLAGRRCSSSGSASARAAGRRTAGSPAASSSGSRWRWPWSGAPSCVFVDEPTAGMDPQARRDTWALLEELRGDGVTIVLTTHYLEEAERLADQVHIIDRGRLIASGTPVRAHPRRHHARSGWSSPSPFPEHAPAVARRRRSAGPTEVHRINEHSLLVTGPADATTLGKVSALVRRARRAARVAEPGAAHPRGRLPPAHRRRGLAVVSTAPAPSRPQPGAAPLARQVRAQARHGDPAAAAQRRAAAARRRHPGAGPRSAASPALDRVDLSLSRTAVDELTPGVLALAIMSTASPRWRSRPASSGATACSSGSAPPRCPGTGCCSARSARCSSSRCSRSCVIGGVALAARLVARR